MHQESKIYIAGHRGMLGSALLRLLQKKQFTNLLTATRHELDLSNQAEVGRFFQEHKPEYVFQAAARVGGIHANNTFRADFLYENLAIQNNIIQQSHVHKVKKLIFLGSSCIYPKNAPQPIKEEYLLSGSLEPTNEPYAIAKIAGLKLCESYARQYQDNFISLMPCNLYGPNDNYDPQNSHVLPALLQKFHQAKMDKSESVTLWGTGSALREFLHVDDCAEACIFLAANYSSPTHINIGSGEEFSILQLAEMIQRIVGYEGEIVFDSSMPDGTPRKLLDNSKIEALGWRPRYSLEAGIRELYQAHFCS